MMYVRMLVALFAVLVATPDWAMATTERSVDASASKVGFRVSHIFVEHVTGTVPIIGGAATFANDSLIPESVTVTLDATRVSTGDPDQTGCIQSPDYFDVKKFPTWTFASTKITPYTATSFGIEGTLTMHGVTQPEHFSVTIQYVGSRQVYRAIGQIDRHVFGMKGSRLDPAIGGIADVTMDVVFR